MARGLTYYKKGSLEVVGLAVAQEVANHNNGENEQNDHEDLKVEIHILTHGPAHNDDQRSIEKRSLNGGTDAMEKSKILCTVSFGLHFRSMLTHDLAIPSFIDSSQMLRSFLDER